jgi:glycine cleavage system transcriptional repressor
MGPDRPGLVKEISEFFSARGINIERSRGCVLGNEFGMIILTSGKTEDIESLISELDNLKQRTGLEINVRKTKAPGLTNVQPSVPYQLSATAFDHPGIVHLICKALSQRGINIDDLSSNVDNNPVTAANIFRMNCSISLPPTIRISDLRNELLRMSDEYNLDIRIDPVIGK